MSKPEKYMMSVPSVEPGETSADLVSHASVYLTIIGHCWSMKNGKTGRFKNAAARKFEEDFAIQVRPEHRKGIGSSKQLLRSSIAVYYPSFRQDLDLALVYDCLEKNGIVTNDRWIREKHEYAYIDKKNPRVCIAVGEI